MESENGGVVYVCPCCNVRSYESNGGCSSCDFNVQNNAIGPDDMHIEARQCDWCNIVGINDLSQTQGACHNCDWTGPEQKEDICPGCGDTDCMAAACPLCGGRYVLIASTTLSALLAARES